MLASSTVLSHGGSWARARPLRQAFILFNDLIRALHGRQVRKSRTAALRRRNRHRLSPLRVGCRCRGGGRGRQVTETKLSLEPEGQLSILERPDGDEPCAAVADPKEPVAAF